MKFFLIFPVLLLAGCMTQKEFPTFAVHRVDTIGSKSGHTALVDVDNDGDIDICTKPCSTGNEYIYIENPMITAPGE